MTPSHAVKKGTRYRYYVSRPLITGARTERSAGLRIPAAEIEQLVTNRMRRLLAEPASLFEMLEAQAGEPLLQQNLMARSAELAKEWARMSPLRMRVVLIALVRRVDIFPDEMIPISAHVGAPPYLTIASSHLTRTGSLTSQLCRSLIRCSCAALARKSGW